MEIRIRGQHFRLLHQKAVYWIETKTLLISDLHLGKITHFRKAGIAAPTAAFESNFIRLEELILQNQPEHIVFLGDLFHNRYNKEWDRFEEWRNRHRSIEMLLLIGNHDILPADLFRKADINLADHWEDGQFLLYHHPIENYTGPAYIISGHVHPVYCLRSSGRQYIKLPCFIVDQGQMILPSCDVFTGGYEMDKVKGREIFVVAGEKVIGV